MEALRLNQLLSARRPLKGQFFRWCTMSLTTPGTALFFTVLSLILMGITMTIVGLVVAVRLLISSLLTKPS